MYGMIKGNQIIKTSDEKCPESQGEMIFFSYDDYQDYQLECTKKKEDKNE